MEDVTEAPKARRKRSPSKRKPETGRKTLATAIVALIVAAADLFLTVRLGIKLF